MLMPAGCGSWSLTAAAHQTRHSTDLRCLPAFRTGKTCARLCVARATLPSVLKKKRRSLARPSHNGGRARLPGFIVYPPLTCRNWLYYTTVLDKIDSIAHGDDGIEVIEQRVAPNHSRTFLLNYRDFLGSCLLVQFIRTIYVLQMQTDVISGTIKMAAN